MTIAFVAVGALAVAVYAGESVTQLTANGQVVSDHLVLMNGRLMVPLRDMATFFGYQVTIANGVAQMSKSAGSVSETGLAQPLENPGQPALPGSTIPAPVTQTPVTPPAVTAPMPVQPGTVTPPSVNPPITPLPSVVVPGTAVTTANEGLFPAITTLPPTVLTGTIGQPTLFGSFVYRVDSVANAGQHYKCRFDQRQPTFNAAWKTDKLEVVYLTVRNTGNAPVYPPSPGTFGVTAFDDQKVGYPVIGVDMRQSPDVANSESSWDIAPLPNGSALLLGPGGKMSYAVVFSVPQERSVSEVVLSLSPDMSGSEAGYAGANLTVRVH